MKIYKDPLRTLAWGTDASFYRQIPKKVIIADNEQQVSEILRKAYCKNEGVTFRAAGTSLSGQSITDSTLLVAAGGWKKWEISPDHSSITLQPGIIGERVNRILSRYGRRFGPDPASVASCMVGGIVANNASGMYCGTRENSDATILSARIVLSDGTILDTGSESSRQSFRSTHPGFISEIESIRDAVRADAALSGRIRYKYSIKNVTGLNLLPFLRQDDPFDIITHLMVGSEGTLAFISSVTMRTLPLEPLQASAMIYFNSIIDAARAVLAIKPLNINTAELLDSRSLESVNDPMGHAHTALLLQARAQGREELDSIIESVRTALEPFELAAPYTFTQDADTCARYWKIRSGIFPTVGAMRPAGTTCLIEDVAFHIQDLPQATQDLSDLLDRFNYKGSCIYGHALEGNFHFIINQSFNTPEDVRRYDDMIHAVAEMVVGKYDGSLKAEHGTGRNMAPFVRYEWGDAAYDVMLRVKRLFDPKGILNSGVIFNDDPSCHLKNTKVMPVANGLIDKCIECGFCESNCLSCGFTLSSRTRIVAVREMEALRRSGLDPRRLRVLRREYSYLGEQTCAADGLCSTSCPMGINVADLTHEIRERGNSAASKAVWNYAGDHFSGVKKMIRTVLDTADLARKVLGDGIMSVICRGLHTMGIPLWTPSYPKGYKAPSDAGPVHEDRPKVVYFPSCLNQMMGAAPHSEYTRPLVEETIALLDKAGYDVIFPAGKDNLCCGTIWESKGMPLMAERKVRELDDALWEASCHGQYPVLCDQSPCLHRMRKCIDRMQLYEPAEFIMKFLKDRLEWHKTSDPIVIHTTCTMKHMGLSATLLELARMCSDSVTVPEDVGCCGFAGDRGMTHPELNAYALRELRHQVAGSGARTGYSNSRTCEIGLQTNSGIPYVSIVYLVNRCTSAVKAEK